MVRGDAEGEKRMHPGLNAALRIWLGARPTDSNLKPTSMEKCAEPVASGHRLAGEPPALKA